MNPIFKNIFTIIHISLSFLAKAILRITLFSVFLAYACNFANMDASHPWQVGFQDPATPIMEGIIFFNGLLMTLMIFIACLVGWLLYKSLTLFDESVHSNPVGFTHSTLLEVVWTITPAAILMVISIPSYNLLYAMDEVIDPSLTIKVVGHQWYWSYECSDFEVAPNTNSEVSTSVQEVRDTQSRLRYWTTALDCARTEAGADEKQTNIVIAQELLDFLEENSDKLEDFSEETSVFVEDHLYFMNHLLIKFEGGKEANYEKFSDEKHLLAPEVAQAVSFVRDKLIEGSLTPEQKELVLKVLKTFKQYVRITDNTELGAISNKFLSPFSDTQGSSSNKGPDNDSDEDSSDDGSVIADLVDFDKSSPYWEWCELTSVTSKYDIDDASLTRAASEAFVSERLCTNAAVTLEDNGIPFSERLRRMKHDLIEFKKAIPIADLSEDKLMDTQLIEYQLRLTRPEREILSSEWAFDNAVVASNFAEFQYETALAELNSAKSHSHWSKIELAASKVNKLTAEYFQADASLGITDPLFVRGLWINEKGYYSWTKFLRLAIKKLSEVERLLFLNAHEELNGANAILGKAQRHLTAEELTKSNAIADNAKSEFLAMEREVVPALEEFRRGKEILANAKLELKNFEGISERADIRLEKAQISFHEAKALSDRAGSKLKASEALFEEAKARLADSDSYEYLTFQKDSLALARTRFEALKKDFDAAVSEVGYSRSDLSLAQERLGVVKVNLEKTEKVFEDTGLLEIQTPVEGKPIEYYPNYLWEIHNEDLAFVKAQLKTDSEALGFALSSLETAEKNLIQVGGELLEWELRSGKALVESLSKESIKGVSLDDARIKVAGIEQSISEAIYNKALANFESEASNTSELILDRATKGLVDSRSKCSKGFLGSVLDITFNDSEKLTKEYAESCIASTREELGAAEADYAKANSLLSYAKSLVGRLDKDLSKNYDNPYLATLRALYRGTEASLENRIEQLNVVRAEFSPLDIKLNEGLLQSKSYREVLLAKAELANIKWLCARVAKTLDIPLAEEVKPFNVQFSHLKSEAPSGENENFYVEGQGADDSGDKKGAKSSVKAKEILIKLNSKEKTFSRVELESDIAESLSGLIESVDNKEARELISLIEKSFDSIVDLETKKIESLKDIASAVKEKVLNVEEEVDSERERINFDSYLIADDDLVIPEASGTGKAGTVFRLLEVDNRLFVPTNTHIRVLVTSADVLHSWAVPSLGVKVDACPGRLNQVFLFVKREGVFYGQCSELCGVNHGFMPIVVQAVSPDEYLTWVGKRLCS